jgi:hypothetical protein
MPVRSCHVEDGPELGHRTSLRLVQNPSRAARNTVLLPGLDGTAGLFDRSSRLLRRISH